MKNIILLTFTIVLTGCSSKFMEFQRTVDKQRAEGYVWKEIPCRQVKENLPAITIDTPTGKKLVCNVLVKP